jgi:hypothetical protein
MVSLPKSLRQGAQVSPTARRLGDLLLDDGNTRAATLAADGGRSSSIAQRRLCRVGFDQAIT